MLYWFYFFISGYWMLEYKRHSSQSRKRIATTTNATIATNATTTSTNATTTSTSQFMNEIELEYLRFYAIRNFRIWWHFQNFNAQCAFKIFHDIIKIIKRMKKDIMFHFSWLSSKSKCWAHRPWVPLIQSICPSRRLFVCLSVTVILYKTKTCERTVIDFLINLLWAFNRK